MKRKVSDSVINRLPRYYRYLGELIASGCGRISSKALSEKMNITASQIRQDLNCFGGFGQQGYGYNVNNLYDEIGKILGINKKPSASSGGFFIFCFYCIFCFWNHFCKAQKAH